ncbi:VOC family protein [Amycolatopsis albispora]|uniref:VOC domain-containing protein n=1 Tax=Amycolatopsis albispora TaxID=1804986 RepID=A0A344LB01_9PSEU|nr:VOC family protein [Amycolatopsis albispora]AXB45225.1 hypothetical protein A4R43_24240 [Amycolatopsis albispora]
MLSLNAVGVPEGGRALYDDLHVGGQVELTGAGAPPDAGCVLTYIVDQPSEVETVLATAVRHGAEVLKPAKKSLFAGFAATCRAPDGTVWKLTAPTRKDTGPAADQPAPTELVAILAVADPKAAKAFYESLGMAVDRDYGAKFIDFQLTPGRPRLGLMTREALTKDAGGLGTAVLTCTADSREEVDRVLAAAVAAGGRITAPAQENGGYAGEFAAPDGHRWKVRFTH